MFSGLLDKNAFIFGRRPWGYKEAKKVVFFWFMAKIPGHSDKRIWKALFVNMAACSSLGKPRETHGVPIPLCSGIGQHMLAKNVLMSAQRNCCLGNSPDMNDIEQQEYWWSRKKSLQWSLRGAKRRRNLMISKCYGKRDCFASVAMTGPLAFCETVNIAA